MEPEATKVCSRCVEAKPLTAFSAKRSSKDGRQPTCKRCWSAWYVQNRDEHITIVTQRYYRKREVVLAQMAKYLNEHPCVDCGETDVRCLEFDHVRGKKSRNISAMLGRGISWEKVLVEIAKCDVRCANCHRRITAERGAHWRQDVHVRLTRDTHATALARLEAVLTR